MNKYDLVIFKNKLKEISQEINTKLAYECIGGTMTGTILENLCDDGVLYHYGNLSLRAITNLDTKDFIFRNKTIKGFWLMEYIKNNFENIDNFYNLFLEDYVNNLQNNIYNSEIQAIFKPENFDEASKLYRNNMGTGKVLLDFTN